MHNAEVEKVLDSVGPFGQRLTTYKLRYWRGIHSEFMTHREFSRNAGSSRARPSQAIIDQVDSDPWGPLHWGANEKGMQATQELSQDDLDRAKIRWKNCAIMAAAGAKALMDLGLHKQVVNRVLEPYTYIDVVVTSSNYANWFALRDHKDADPTIRDLAARMLEEHNRTPPKYLNWDDYHLPFIVPGDANNVINQLTCNGTLRKVPTKEEINNLLMKVSAARCARTSYKAFDGTVATIDQDLDLFNKLVTADLVHASPTEHQAWPDMSRNGKWLNEELHGNFKGWCQFRKTIPNEYISETSKIFVS